MGEADVKAPLLPFRAAVAAPTPSGSPGRAPGHTSKHHAGSGPAAGTTEPAGGGSQPPAPPQPNDHKIGVLSLAALIFFSVSGGPYGCEEAILTAGPLVTFVLLGVLSLCWSVPEALITCELAPAFPEPSGSVAWVSYAFGPFWAWMKGWLSWLSGVTDNAIYPTLLLDYVCNFFRSEADEAGLDLDRSGWDRTAVLVGLTLALTYLNYRGLDVVGNTVAAISVVSLLPFVIMVVAGLVKGLDVGRLAALPAGGLKAVRWSECITLIFWNVNYYDNAAPFAGDVKQPGRAFPRGMALAMVVVVLSTALPLMVAVGATSFPFDQFKDGFFSTVAESLCGKWLGAWIVFSSAIASVGMFEGEMASDAFSLMGLAERGMLPAVFARRSKYGTPTLGILFSASGILVLSLMPFLEIIQLLNSLYCLATFIEFAAFIKIRYQHPELERPYRVPLGNAAMCVLLAVPTALLVFNLYLATALTWAVMAGGTLAGVGLYYLLAHPAVRACCKFRIVTQEGEEEAHHSSSEDEDEDGDGDGGGEGNGGAGGSEDGYALDEVKHEGGGALLYGSDGEYAPAPTSGGGGGGGNGRGVEAV